MSVELPEAQILARQMDATLKGKVIRAYSLEDHERLQRIGFLNREIGAFGQLVGRTVEGATSSGNTIRLRLDAESNLILAPEYGGVILYHVNAVDVPKFHLRLDFADGSLLTARMTSMGIIYVAHDHELDGVYVYKRDFKGGLSPIGPEFTTEQFQAALASRNTQLKQVLVGKDAVVVGLSNSAFQDILYRASIHPKRKASELSEAESLALYDSIRGLIEERLIAGGKDEFIDLYGMKGNYRPYMGPNMKDRECTRCGKQVQSMALGGGQVYYCQQCQI